MPVKFKCAGGDRHTKKNMITIIVCVIKEKYRELWKHILGKSNLEKQWQISWEIDNLGWGLKHIGVKGKGSRNRLL